MNLPKEEQRVLRNRVNVPIQPQLKQAQKQLKRSAGLNVIDEHDGDQKTFCECDEPDAKRYVAQDKDSNNFTILKEMSTMMTIDSAKKPTEKQEDVRIPIPPGPKRSAPLIYKDDKNENCASTSLTSNESKPDEIIPALSKSKSTKLSHLREGTSVNISANVTIDMSMSIQSLQDDQAVPQPQNEEYDFDKESENDITSAAFFVKDIFLYLKSREDCFSLPNYLPSHPQITVVVRAQLVNWLVEVQESFELNHETLYLGVKIFDMFMSKTQNVGRDLLQLIATASLMVASKFEERMPPLIDDYIYLSNDTLSRNDIMTMERILCRKIEFNVGLPLSYCFLRRYSRVTKAEELNDMATLTLARYILETSLMFLNFCRVQESLISAACFSLALRMRKLGDWTPTLQKYSGYTKEEVEPMVWALNHMLIQSREDHAFSRFTTVYSKYSHEIFLQVALIRSLDDPLKGSPIDPPAIYLPPENSES